MRCGPRTWWHMRINCLRRREFITLLGGAAAWPLAAHAQQPTSTKRLGLLFASAQAAKAQGLLEAVTQGLKEHGWVEGPQIAFAYRFSDGEDEVLQAVSSEPCLLRLDSIFTAT